LSGDFNAAEEFQGFGEHYGMFLLDKRWEERNRFQNDFDFREYYGLCSVCIMPEHATYP